MPHDFLHLFLLPGKIGHGAAPFLGGIGRHLATVNGEHVLADQVHFIANQKDLEEKRDNLVLHGRDEIGNGRKMGPFSRTGLLNDTRFRDP